MEILGMSIAIAAVVAAFGGIVLKNGIGYLRKDTEPFDVKKSIASGLIAFFGGVPLIIIAFESAFGSVDVLPETAQLAIFMAQVLIVSGLDSVSKGVAKAAAKTK